jgi:hypothetical protein
MTSGPSRDFGEDSVVVGVLHFCFAFTRQCEKKPAERTSSSKDFATGLRRVVSDSAEGTKDNAPEFGII